MLQTTYFKTMTYFSDRQPEVAGVLFALRHDESLITDFVPDTSGRGTSVSFELDAANLNRLLKEKKALGLTCTGIIHSHPGGITQPSFGDLHYFRTLFAAPANGAASHLFVPIVCDGRLYPFAFANNDVHSACLTLV